MRSMQRHQLQVIDPYHCIATIQLLISTAMSKLVAVACLLLFACNDGGNDSAHDIDAGIAREPIENCVAPYCSWSSVEAECAKAAAPTAALRPPERTGGTDLGPIYLALSRLSLSGAP